jgi:hypothetical protein
MTFDEIKKLAKLLLHNYETAWQESAALRAIIQAHSMPDGTKGIPRWEETLAEFLSDPDAKARTHAVFAPLYARIAASRAQSEVLELLRRFPPVGGVN